MPELPEVETMRRGILSLVGRTIAGVERARCRRRPIAIEPSLPTFRRRAIGRTITAIDRIGKRVVLRLETGDSIILEPRMTGLVLLSDPPTQDHLRLRIALDPEPRTTTDELLYWDRRGLGSVRLVSPREFAVRYGLEKIGPDALAISCDTLRERLAGSRRAIKVALLDQRAVAGVGNLYASELLFLAGVHPARRCDRLTSDEWSSIHAAMLDVLTDAIRHEGSTLSDGTYRNALNQAGGYQNHHRVYDREAEPCKQCRTAVVRIVQAQRATFFCPGCQSNRRPRAGRKTCPGETTRL